MGSGTHLFDRGYAGVEPKLFKLQDGKSGLLTELVKEPGCTRLLLIEEFLDAAMTLRAELRFLLERITVPGIGGSLAKPTVHSSSFRFDISKNLNRSLRLTKKGDNADKDRVMKTVVLPHLALLPVERPVVRFVSHRPVVIHPLSGLETRQ